MNSYTKNSRQPVVLCILDGWGYRATKTDNAIIPANTPNFQRIWNKGPSALINTSGLDVGLPAGQMGNSEVGHMNLGAGRIVNQDIQRIDASIEGGLLDKNPALSAFISALKSSGGTCHLLGLLSPGGVHSHQRHLLKLAEILSMQDIPVAVHAFLDGRDTPPVSGREFTTDFNAALSACHNATIATLCGRFYAMDRDERWDRVEKAFNLIVSGTGKIADDVNSAIGASYEARVTDEFLEPVAINGYPGVSDGDGLLMANFRADRSREILSALLDPHFANFKRTRSVNFAAAIGLTEYSSCHNALMETMFPPERLNNILGSVLAEAGKRQLRIAETEKYAHVTFFFNGGEEAPFPGEDRILIPSPKVRTYDLQPEMSAQEVTDRLLIEIESNKYDFILVNYANPDMVGHTGILSATEIAIRTVDDCVGRLSEAVQNAGGTMLITADHGNAETLRDERTGEPHTSHTLNAVPAVVVNPPTDKHGLANGRLADIAPTLLDFMGIETPTEMSGISLATTTTRTQQDHVPA